MSQLTNTLQICFIQLEHCDITTTLSNWLLRSIQIFLGFTTRWSQNIYMPTSRCSLRIFRWCEKKYRPTWPLGTNMVAMNWISSMTITYTTTKHITGSIVIPKGWKKLGLNWGCRQLVKSLVRQMVATSSIWQSATWKRNDLTTGHKWLCYSLTYKYGLP